MSRPIDPNKAIDFIIDNAPRFAAAKADRVQVEEYRKSKKALLMQAHNEKPIGAQEREAYAHPEYIALLDGLRAAVEQEELLKWQMTAAQMRVDVWRSMESTSRAQDRATT